MNLGPRARIMLGAITVCVFVFVGLSIYADLPAVGIGLMILGAFRLLLLIKQIRAAINRPD
ncbi:MAG: hypothetical protein HN348_16090 [Proteobacteria bacterium]|nr:hypothetical protein [Pseudomonadota bacterium]